MSEPGQRGSWRMLRSVRLFRLFLREQADPDGFYTAIAHDSASQLTEFTDAAGKTAPDIGSTDAYYPADFRTYTQNDYPLELDPPQTTRSAAKPPAPALTDSYRPPR